MSDFKPGDMVRVAFDLEVDADGKVHLCAGGYWSVADLAEQTGVHVAPFPDPPGPYTTPRENDEVEVTEVSRGIVRKHGSRYWVERTDADAGSSLPHWRFEPAVAEGRVRLVKAAPPSYEPGRIYQSESTGQRYLYAPNGELALRTSNWFGLSEAGWIQDADLPADLVPCDGVPRGDA